MLNGPQRKFCEGIVKGLTGEAAYLKAYTKCSPRAARANAARLLAKDDFKAEIEKLRAKADEEAGSAVMTLVEKRCFLARVVRTPVGKVTADSHLAQEVTVDEKTMKVKMPDKLRAMELDAKLAGELAQDKAADKQAEATSELAKALATIKEATHGRRSP